jgi:hypothetical protein
MIEYALNNLGGCDFLGLGLVGRDYAMPKDIRRKLLDVVRCDIAAALEEGMSPGCSNQKDAGAG